MSQSQAFRLRYRIFEIWKMDLDKECVRLCGVDSDGLPDYCIRDAYDRGEWPKDVAQDVVDSAKEY